MASPFKLSTALASTYGQRMLKLNLGLRLSFSHIFVPFSALIFSEDSIFDVSTRKRRLKISLKWLLHLPSASSCQYMEPLRHFRDLTYLTRRRQSTPHDIMHHEILWDLWGAHINTITGFLKFGPATVHCEVVPSTTSPCCTRAVFMVCNISLTRMTGSSFHRITFSTSIV